MSFYDLFKTWNMRVKLKLLLCCFPTSLIMYALGFFFFRDWSKSDISFFLIILYYNTNNTLHEQCCSIISILYMDMDHQLTRMAYIMPGTCSCHLSFLAWHHVCSHHVHVWNPFQGSDFYLNEMETLEFKAHSLNQWNVLYKMKPVGLAMVMPEN